MNVSIHFNWPIGEDSVSVEMGQPNINDAEFEFRIGVIPRENKEKIWFHEDGWVIGGKDMKRINFTARRGDKVVVHKKKIKEEKPESRVEWDIDEHWPAEAHGPSMTIVPWYF